jgi:hypothetical protein
MPVLALLASPFQSYSQVSGDLILNTADTGGFLRSHPGFSWSDGEAHSGANSALQGFLTVDARNPLHEIRRSFGGEAAFSFAGGRMKLVGTSGGVFVPFRSVYSMPNGWFTETTAGVRIALDPHEHFWLGGTAHYLTDFADKKRQWAYESADLTIEFGH